MAHRPRPYPGPRPSLGAQPDLLDWQPPETTVAFDPASVRAATLRGRIAMAVSVAMKDSPLDRGKIAERMAAFLDEPITKGLLDNYAALSRPDHNIPVTKFVALLHVTGDRRLLELLAEMMGWAVIERRHLPMIELAAAQERHTAMAREVEALRRKARAGGGL